MKICSKCELPKPKQDFSPCSRAADKLSYWCKQCRAALSMQQRRDKGVLPASPRLSCTETHKECGKCHKLLPLLAFSPSKKGTNGKQSYCKGCINLSRKTQEAREYSRQKTMEYRRKHKFRWRAKHRLVQYNRKAQIKATATGTVTDEVLEKLYRMANCFYCAKPTPLKKRTIDHKQPLNQGGLHDAANLVMACLHCNSSKQDKTAEEFYEFRTRIYNISA